MIHAIVLGGRRIPENGQAQAAAALRQHDVSGPDRLCAPAVPGGRDHRGAGGRGRRIQRSIDLSGVDVVLNEDYREGQLSSLIAGLRNTPAETDAILVCLVDNPFILPAIVNSDRRPVHTDPEPDCGSCLQHEEGASCLIFEGGVRGAVPGPGPRGGTVRPPCKSGASQ